MALTLVACAAAEASYGYGGYGGYGYGYGRSYGGYRRLYGGYGGYGYGKREAEATPVAEAAALVGQFYITPYSPSHFIT